jgi:hypothetical protein
MVQGTFDFSPWNIKVSRQQLRYFDFFQNNSLYEYGNFLSVFSCTVIALSGLYSVSHPLVKFRIDISEIRTPPRGEPAPLPQTIHMLGLRYTRLPFLYITPYFRPLRSIGKLKHNETLCRKSCVDFTGLEPRKEVSKMVGGGTRPFITLHNAAFSIQSPLAYVNQPKEKRAV